MLHHTVYKITNRINDKFYIGVHSTNDVNDGYMGSGIVIKRAIEKYGTDNFDKVILFDYDNQNDMIQMEKLLVDEIFVECEDTYNLMTGGGGAGIPGKETRAKMSKIHKGKTLSKEQIEILRQSHLNRVISKETKQKLSNAMKGKKHSIETKKKISDSKKGTQAGINNPMYGVRRFGEDNPMWGRVQSRETRNLIAEKLKDKYSEPESTPWYGKTLSEEHRKKISESKKGVKMSAEFKKNLSEKNSGKLNLMHGKTHTEDAKRKISVCSRLYHAFRKNNVDLIKRYQKEYFEIYGVYHSKYMEFIVE